MCMGIFNVHVWECIKVKHPVLKGHVFSQEACQEVLSHLCPPCDIYRDVFGSKQSQILVTKSPQTLSDHGQIKFSLNTFHSTASGAIKKCHLDFLYPLIFFARYSSLFRREKERKEEKKKLISFFLLNPSASSRYFQRSEELAALNSKAVTLAFKP